MIEDETKIEKSLLVLKDSFLTQALDAKPETHQLFILLENHHRASAEESVRVAKIAVFLSQQSGVSDDDRLMLGRASLMHDVGKIEVPVEVLEAGLFDELAPEIRSKYLEGIRKHSETSSWLLMKIGDERVAGIVLAHHQFQKNEYPKKKVELNQRDYRLAQILALSDQIDSLLSKRPYKKAFSVEETIKVLRENEKLPGELIESAVKFREGLNQ